MIAMSNRLISNDPQNHENPDDYDPLRFYNLRKKSGRAGRHKFVSLSTDMLPFSYGRWVCPGRFMARDQIIISLILLLKRYDFRFSEEGRAHLAPNIYAFSIIPNLKSPLQVKSKDVKTI